MAKKTFETVLKWNGGEAFRAKVEVGADGWGRVFDTAGAEYVTEWLGIVLCRVCGQQDVSMPPFEAGAAPVAQFRWFIQKAARQAGAIRRAILLGRVSKALFAEKAWEGLDSAETFLGSFLSENVYRERRRMR